MKTAINWVVDKRRTLMKFGMAYFALELVIAVSIVVGSKTIF